MILVIDNHDSFTYNLVQLIEAKYDDVKVIFNDELTLTEVKRLNPKGIVLSPGPCTPAEAGICIEAVKHFYNQIPILGICLGHQSICVAFGGEIIRAKHLVHGKIDKIKHNHHGFLSDLPKIFTATRYHSLIVDEATMPDMLVPTSYSISDNYIMGVKHKDYPVEGVQFHPESYMTKDGHKIINRFIEEVISHV